jgi:tetratricopeptide (TPR) repeat protein
VEVGQQILKLAERLEDPFYQALAYLQNGLVLLWSDDPGTAREWIVKAYEATSRMGARLWQARSLAYLSVASRKLDDLNAVREQTRDLLDLSTALDEPTYHGIGLANQGWLAWREGNPTLAERLCKNAYEDWNKFGGDVFHGLAGWVLLAVAVSQRDLETAKSHALTLLDPNPAYQPMEEIEGNLLNQALSACQVGQVEAAENFFKLALERAREIADL